MVFGRSLQACLSKTKIFVVGAGALGCEELKNYAMMGVGHITVTDMDMISRSNLQRQFLFRAEDVDSSKSTVAARRVKEMNPLVEITAFCSAVTGSGSAEGHFDAAFWEGLDCVVSAVDNVKTRALLLEFARSYHLPMLDAGIQGASGNTNIIIPGVSTSYYNYYEAEAEGSNAAIIPVCTVKSRPTSVHHIIPWAMLYFESVLSPKKSDLRGSPESPISPLGEILSRLISGDGGEGGEEGAAVDLFRLMFGKEIELVQEAHPEDESSNGGLGFLSFSFHHHYYLLLLYFFCSALFCGGRGGGGGGWRARRRGRGLWRWPRPGWRRRTRR